MLQITSPRPFGQSVHINSPLFSTLEPLTHDHYLPFYLLSLNKKET